MVQIAKILERARHEVAESLAFPQLCHTFCADFRRVHLARDLKMDARLSGSCVLRAPSAQVSKPPRLWIVNRRHHPVVRVHKTGPFAPAGSKANDGEQLVKAVGPVKS